MIELDKETIAHPDSQRLDDPRAINEILALLDATWLDPAVHARPTHYNIATSVVCNIKCVFCPRQTFGPEVSSGFLKVEYFDPIVPHFEAALRTGLFGLGEPFLNKRFFDFVGAAKSRGTYTMTSSHGMSLTDPVIDKIIDSGLDELCVSFDGARRRTTNFLRNGADLDTIVANVTRLLKRRRERGVSHPRVHISFTVSKYNVWEMSRMVRLANKMGADQLAFSNLVLDHPEHAHVSAVGSRVFSWNLKRALDLAARIGVKASYFPQNAHPYEPKPHPPIRPGDRWGCPEAWRALIVEKDGTLKPCCYLQLTFGNSRDGDLASQLNSDKAIAFRRTFTENRFLNTCKGCGQFYRITDEETEQNFRAVRTLLDAGNFSEATRIMIEEKLAYFEALFAEKKASRN